MLLVSLRISITYAYYYIDSTGFIEKFCENKDKPELKCNGKCHLKKVVEKNTDNEEIPLKAIDFKEINLFVVEQMTYNLINVSIEKLQISYDLDLYSYSSTYQFDHPPQI